MRAGCRLFAMTQVCESRCTYTTGLCLLGLSMSKPILAGVNYKHGRVFDMELFHETCNASNIEPVAVHHAQVNAFRRRAVEVAQRLVLGIRHGSFARGLVALVSTFMPVTNYNMYEPVLQNTRHLVALSIFTLSCPNWCLIRSKPILLPCRLSATFSFCSVVRWAWCISWSMCNELRFVASPA